MSLKLITVGQLRGEDRDEWIGLWREYLQFYEADLPQEVTDRTWLSIQQGDRVRGLGAHCDGTLAGFAITVVHEATWSVGMTTYLEDLFVAPAARGLGVGRALIERVIADARKDGRASVYWHTRCANVAARRLYDRYAKADDFVRYRVRLG